MPLGLVAVPAWKLGIAAPLPARLDRRPARRLMAYAALLLASIVTHSRIEGVVDPAQLLFGSAATIAVWTSTIAILARSDRAFVGLLGTSLRRAPRDH
jgi:hypothetical protein